jgi:hypothetical protein
MLGWECRATGMKPETVDRHVRKEAAGREAATSARAEAAVMLRTAATEAVAALPAAAAPKRRALEAAIKGGDADSSAHRRALRDAVQKARKKAMGHSPRGHQERLMARFPDLGPFVMALVTQMGGRATERRDTDLICIKSTYSVIASIVSARFGVCISARWLCKHSRKHARRKGLQDSLDISTRCIQRTLLPTESEQPNAWMLNHSMRALLLSAYVNITKIACSGRDDHATISGGVVTDGKMVQVRAAQCAARVASGYARACRS